MSKLSEYSKFDHIGDDDDDSDNDDSGVVGSEQVLMSSSGASSAGKQEQQHVTVPGPLAAAGGGDGGTATAATHPENNLTTTKKSSMTKRDDESGRFVFEYGGRKVYEWEQTLEEVNLYVEAPPGVSSGSQIVCTITPTKLTLGLRGADRPYLDERTFSKVIVSDSSWCLDPHEGIINIILAKAFRGETWDAPLVGHAGAGEIVDPMTKQQIQKDLMLERFQEEHPGFDFRGASFNGSVPDPRTFLGGVKYS